MYFVQHYRDIDTTNSAQANTNFLGTSAQQNKEVGSWFVYAIGAVFCKHAKNNDLNTLYEKVLLA